MRTEKEDEMKTFVFRNAVDKITLHEENHLVAMAKANTFLNWKGVSQNGAWMETNGSSNEFRWVEGNFFD